MKLGTKAGGRGFSLLELTISLAVIATALVAGLSFILHTLAAKESMRELQVAKSAVDAKMEDIKAQAWDNLNPYVTAQMADTNPVTSPLGVTGIFNADPARRNQRAMMVITINGIPAASPTIWDVAIRIDWRGPQGRRTYRINNLISQF